MTMAKTITQAFTDYPDRIMRPVMLLSYDNNKYATVLFEHGREDSIKTGYIYADPSTKRPVAAIHWHVLGGGTRRSYKRRNRTTTYRLQSSDGYSSQRAPYEDKTYRCKAAAVQAAAHYAVASQEDVWVFGSTYAHNRMVINETHIVVRVSGDAFELRRRRVQKYLLGYGKRPRGTL